MKPLHILIGVASICVIAATGTYLVTEYRGSVAASADASSRNTADVIRRLRDAQGLGQ